MRTPVLLLLLISATACAASSEGRPDGDAVSADSALTTGAVVAAVSEISNESGGRVAFSNGGSDIGVATAAGQVTTRGRTAVRAEGLRYDGTAIYYGEERFSAPSGIYRMDASGKETKIGALPRHIRSTAAGIDGDAVYFVAVPDYFYGSRTIYRFSKSTSALEDVGSGGGGNFPDLVSFAAGGGRAFWSAVVVCGNGSLGSSNNCERTRLYQSGDPSGYAPHLANGEYVVPATLKVSGGDLYLANDKGIYKIALGDLRTPVKTVCAFPPNARVAIGAGTILAGMPDAGFDVSPTGFLVPTRSADGRFGQVVHVSQSSCAMTPITPNGSRLEGSDFTLGKSPVAAIRAAGPATFWLDRTADRFLFRLMLTRP